MSVVPMPATYSVLSASACRDVFMHSTLLERRGYKTRGRAMQQRSSARQARKAVQAAEGKGNDGLGAASGRKGARMVTGKRGGSVPRHSTGKRPKPS